MVSSIGEQEEELRRALNTESTRGQIAVDALSQKALERLIAIAKGEAIEAEEVVDTNDEKSESQIDEDNEEKD